MLALTLGSGFEDLEVWGQKWCLNSDLERLTERVDSTFEDLVIFYDTLLPRMDEIIEYLNEFPVDDLSGDELRLYQLAQSFFEVALAVEHLRAPDEEQVFAISRLVID
jgi:hypothetical protein